MAKGSRVIHHGRLVHVRLRPIVANTSTDEDLSVVSKQEKERGWVTSGSGAVVSESLHRKRVLNHWKELLICDNDMTEKETDQMRLHDFDRKEIEGV